jgi:hypothetical protein
MLEVMDFLFLEAASFSFKANFISKKSVFILTVKSFLFSHQKAEPVSESGLSEYG